MGICRLSCSSYRSLAAALSLFAVAYVLPTNASAQQVRLGGGGGSPVTLEFLEDIVVTFKPGASPVLAAGLGIQLDNVIGDGTGLGFNFNLTATPSNILDYKPSPTDPLVPVSGGVVAMGNLSQGSDFQITVNLPTVAQFDPGGSYSFKAGSIAWPSAGTTAPWVPNPQTITLTPEMLFADFEGPSFLSSSEVTVAAVPEPSTYCIALAGLSCGGYLVRRRRKHQA